MSRKKHYTSIEFQTRLKACIDDSGLSVIEVAKKVGCNRKTIYDYYYGDTCPDAVTFMRLCKLFKKSAEYMWGWVNE